MTSSKIVSLTILLGLACATNIKSQLESQAQWSSSFSSLAEFFDYSVGTWVGGGVIELTRPDEFKTNSRLVEPNGFEELSEEDWTIPGSFQRIYMHETI